MKKTDDKEEQMKEKGYKGEESIFSEIKLQFCDLQYFWKSSVKGHQFSFLIICFLVSYKPIMGFLGSVSCSLVLSATMPRCFYESHSYFLGDTKGPAQEIYSRVLRSQLQKVP